MSPRESNPDQPRLLLEGEGAIGRAVEAARLFGEAQRLAESDVARLCIVVEELVANLYDHGEVTGQDDVIFALAREPRGIRVSITDGGIPFNPWTTPAVASGQGAGAGVKLIQAWAELIRYHSSEDGNQLELLVPIEGGARALARPSSQ